MLKVIAGIVAGLITWIIVATMGNLLFRFLWPGYAEAEISMMFTLAMMIGRLALGALSSVCGGVAVAWIAKGSGAAAWILGIVLTALFVPVHDRLWDKFPNWYHVIFLAQLLPLTLLGSMILRHRNRTMQTLRD